MPETSRHDAWHAGDSYDAYMGRWSRQIAPRFLDWLDATGDLDWLEVGCGTGVLSTAILAQCDPMRAFWRVATALDPNALDLTEDKRFPFCTREGLINLAEVAGLAPVDCTAIEVPTVFKDFDDFWHPFTLGAGPAPGYCMSLSPDARERLREKLQDDLPQQEDGSIRLKARAWAIKAAVA